MILIDTSSLVHVLRRQGDPGVKERVKAILRTGDAATCDMIAIELWMGVGSPQDEADVRELLSLLVSLPIDAPVWNRARSLARACREEGTPVPSSDILIAACAFTNGADIEYEDAHFELLERYRA